MKKLFIIILAITAVFTTVSCNQTFGDSMSDYERQREQSAFKLIELSFEGHSHQFIFYHGLYTVDHWPSCKFCEEPSAPAEETTPEKPVLRKIETLQRQQVELSTFQNNKNL